ncbi:hypothetical protein AAA214_03025 [Parabacteroides goldsteinii]|uniref:hypothetical protein n=1 Tax=Parabacteroides goldsteinii TaxID=328812 RepID=UPI0032C05D7F
MSVKQVLQIESNVVTDQPVKIPFEFIRLDLLPEGKKLGDSIVITPLTVRSWFRIKPLLLYIDKQDREILTANKDTGFKNEIADLMAKYDEIIFEIVCLGIHNKRGNMPAWFREVLKDNCTWEDIYILLNAILFRIGCNPFSRTITALEAVSPLDEEELIALQKNNETWKNRNRKAASCS